MNITEADTFLLIRESKRAMGFFNLYLCVGPYEFQAGLSFQPLHLVEALADEISTVLGVRIERG